MSRKSLSAAATVLPVSLLDLTCVRMNMRTSLLNSVTEIRRNVVLGRRSMNQLAIDSGIKTGLEVYQHQKEGNGRRYVL